MPSEGLDRRTMLAGLAFLGSPRGQAPETLRLQANLHTRVGAEVWIEGRGPYAFVVDTGAASTVVADDLADALGLKPGPNVRIHGITASDIMPSVGIDRLLLAGRAARHLRCPVLPRSSLAADGLLGLDILSRYRMRFNFHQRTAMFMSPDRLSLDMRTKATRLTPRVEALSRGPFGQMLFDRVRVGGVSAVAFIDSGAQYSVANGPLLRALIATLDQRPGNDRYRLHGVTGQSVEAIAAAVSEIEVAGRRLGPTSLFFADLYCFSVMGLSDQPTLLIGADLLARFREVMIDFPRQTVSFEGARPARSAAV